MLNEHSLNSYWAPNKNTGFIPQKVPIKPEDLVSSQYSSLRAIGTVAPKLGSMPDDELEEFVTDLSDEPDITPSSTTPALCEAVVRSYVNIAAHLIHRPQFVSRRELPEAIARPLWSFSQYTGRPPSLTYASYALANFTTPAQRRMLPEDFQIAQTPSGTADEEWFVAAHLSIESTGGEVVEAIEAIEKSIQNTDVNAIVTALESIESCLAFSTKVMPTVMERMNADVFLNKIRPLLYGHAQITFRGVDGDRAVTYVGETGAQSGVIRAIDSILSIEHSAEITTPMNKFIQCAPPAHQKFFEYTSGVGKQLLAMNKNPKISSAHHSTKAALTKFRESHLRAVANYLMPDGKKLAKYGTGGTHHAKWLKQMINETKN